MVIHWNIPKNEVSLPRSLWEKNKVEMWNVITKKRLNVDMRTDNRNRTYHTFKTRGELLMFERHMNFKR